MCDVDALTSSNHTFLAATITSVGSDPSAGLAFSMRASTWIDSSTEMMAGARMKIALYGVSLYPGVPYSFGVLGVVREHDHAGASAPDGLAILHPLAQRINLETIQMARADG